LFQFTFSQLELSHALAAVRSPGTAKKLDNQRASRNQARQGKPACAIRRRKSELRRGQADS
jgi:hypothetical protein